MYVIQNKQLIALSLDRESKNARALSMLLETFSIMNILPEVQSAIQDCAKLIKENFIDLDISNWDVKLAWNLLLAINR